ncbi:hypothetical protein EAF04_000684 [Stromatinia cepivora]|nr:hypothetical protein EAF04_000684 [Stromatinia cepivora]
MPVTTRSQSKRALSSIPHDAKPHPAIKYSSRNKNHLKSTIPNDSSQNLTISPKPPRQPKQKPKRRRPLPKKESEKPSPKSQDLGKDNPNQTSTTLSPLDTFTHYFCQQCDCPQGIFASLVDSCVQCGHPFRDHHDMNNPWRPICDILCERSDLVDSILQRVRDMRVVVIRSIPLVGKTVLLNLLGYHIHKNCPDLEPIFVEWKTEKQRNNLPYEKYLQVATAVWKAKNAELRPHNPRATKIFLIDEGQNSYEDNSFWYDQLNYHIMPQPLYIIVSLSGISSLSATHHPNDLSKVRRINSFQCVELRPSTNGNRYMLFKLIETHTMVIKWATAYKFQLESGISEYLHAVTDGHPGILDKILSILRFSFPYLSENIRRQRLWTLDLCYSVIHEHNALLDRFSIRGGGFWVPNEEALVRQYLNTSPLYSHIPFSKVVEALRKVATLLHGYTLPTSHSNKAFTFCHDVGLLHTEQRRPGSDETAYFFASPIHRKVAYRHLFAASEPDTILDQITLQQTCLNAIERFLSILKTRPIKPHINWRIPEATFQNEIYCCLNHELHNIDILSEYSHISIGQIDFYIFSKKWGIEILQSGKQRTISEYISQFRVEGKYHGWGVMDDFIILNFCSKSSLQPLEIRDVDIQSHILQVAIDFEECTAEVYTYDNKLKVTLDLGEGRQRSYSAEPDTSQESLDPYMQLRDSKISPNESEKTEQELRNELA